MPDFLAFVRVNAHTLWASTLTIHTHGIELPQWFCDNFSTALY